MLHRLLCRVGLHDWHVRPYIRGLTPSCLCIRCGKRNSSVRWFPDRFRWFSYPILTELQFLEIQRIKKERHADATTAA